MANQDLNIVVKLIDQASGELKKLSGSLDSFGDDVKKQTEWARKFTTAMIWAGTIIGGLAVKEFATFEKQMSKVKAITGATDEQFWQLTAIAKQMGATTAFTADEAGNALEFLGMAWLNAQQSMAALPGTLQLAAAANMELGTAADIATNIMAQFWIEAENIQRVNDVLAKSATSANTNVQEMAEAMKYMGPVANALRVPLEETAAAINILANNGIKWGMAGQSFSASLLRITDLTPAAARSVDELWLSLFDQNGQFVGLTDTVKQLEKGLANATDEQKAMHISNIFWIQSSKQWLTLIKDGSDELERYTEMLENSAGTAEQMAKVQLDNLAWSFTILKSAISGVMIELGARLAPVLRQAVEGLTDLITNFTEKWESLSPAMQNIIMTAGAVAAALAGITVVVWLIGFALPALIAGFSALAATLGFIISPIGLVIAAIAGLAIAWKTNFLGLQDATKAAVDIIKPLFESIVEGAKQLFEGVSEWVNRIKEPFMTVVNFLKPFIEDYLNNFLEFFKSTFENLITFLSGAWEVISGIIQVALSIIWGIIEIALNLITGNWEGAWNALKEMLAGVWEGIKLIISGAVTMLGALLKQFLDTTKLYFSNIWTSIKLFLAGIWEGIKGIFGDSIEWISGAIEKGGAFISDVWTNTMEAAKNITTSIWDSIKQTIATSINWIIDKINWLIEKINSISGTVWVPAIPLIPRLEFQNGGVVPGFQTGGIIPGGKNPAHHDQVPAMLDPGELILNRAQQKNLSLQMSQPGGQAIVINLTIWNNNFYGDDEGFIEKIWNTIVEKVNQNLAINAF